MAENLLTESANNSDVVSLLIDLF